MPAGRPTDFTPELGAEICLRIASYTFPKNSLTRICKDEKLPCRTTLYTWVMNAALDSASQDEKEFLNRYKQACEIKIDNMLDESIDIAYDESNDLLNGKYGEVGNSTAVSRATLKVNLLKWALSKLKPEKYGDRMEQVHSGSVTMTLLEQIIEDEDGKNSQ